MNGYVNDIGYTYGYYEELNPLIFEFVSLLRLNRPAKINTACELGYGEGISLNIHSNSSDIAWYGTDFSAEHFNFASYISGISKNNAKLFSESFLDFIHRKDLPDFDFIGLHGVLSWIDKKNQKYILDFIKKKLAHGGGGLYISYNTLPGVVDLLPLRNLIKNHSLYNTSHTQNSFIKANLGIDFIDNLVALGADFIKNHPILEKYATELKSKDRSYIAHEFMNKSWALLDFMKLSTKLKNIQCNFVSPAQYGLIFNNINFNAKELELLNSISDLNFREYTKDFIRNMNFRRDYYSKGSLRISFEESKKLLQEKAIVLIESKDKVEFSFNTRLGKADLSKDYYGRIIDILSDNKPKTIAQIQEDKELQDFSKLLEGIVILLSMNYIKLAHTSPSQSAIDKSYRFNQFVIQNSDIDYKIGFLSSPVTGSGIPVNRVWQIFLKAISEGKKTQKEYEKYAFDILKNKGEKLIKNGKVLESERDNEKEIHDLADNFEKYCPIFKNLKMLSFL